MSRIAHYTRHRIHEEDMWGIEVDHEEGGISISYIERERGGSFKTESSVVIPLHMWAEVRAAMDDVANREEASDDE